MKVLVDTGVWYAFRDPRDRPDERQVAFDMSLRKRPARPLSMVDCLIRLILDDARLRIERFATYNEPDFHDVCQARVIEVVR